MTCCTCVVQQDDHVVPGQAVLGLQHGSVPPGVQSVHVSVLVSVLVAAGRRKTTMMRTCFPFISFHLCSCFFSLHALLIPFKEAPGKPRRSPLPGVQGCSSSLGIFSESGWHSSSSAPPSRTPAGCFERCPDSSKRPRSRVCRRKKKQTGVGKQKKLEKFCESFGKTH